MIEIKNRFTGEVIHNGEFDSVRDCLINAIEKDANLCGANLRDANLRDANLQDANLQGANLWDANLQDANLQGANLRGANLQDANLCGANLQGADLWGADLQDANLQGADLCGANLCGANLQGADLWGANLCGANLQGASLWGCAGNKEHIKSIWCIDTYLVTYTATHIQIGCERHSIKEWDSFDDARISKMEGEKALSFWRENKDFIMSTVKRFPAKPTGKENE